jgi:hypothetical protein
MSLKDLFIPKKRDFIGLLLNQTQKVEEGMKLLYDFVESPDKGKGDKVVTAEQEADELRRILVDELNKSFITPIDREDIFALSRTIDDMLDYAKSTVEETLLFQVETDIYMKKMAEALCSSAKEITAAIKLLTSNPGVCSEHIIRAKKAENFVEHRYREGLVELFKSNDVVAILKKREIYRHLSNAADRADEAANIIGDILVKTT